MTPRQLYLLSALTLVSVAGIAMVWEFALEDWVELALGDDFIADPPALKWKMVVTEVVMAAIALVLPLVLSVMSASAGQRAMAAVLESERRFHDLVDLSPDAIMVHAEGRILYANTAAAKLLGLGTPYDLVGTAFIELFHPDSRAGIADRLARLRAGGDPEPMAEMTLLRGDGSSFIAETVSGTTRFMGQRACQSVIRDVSQRLEAERKLRHQAGFREVLLDTVPLPIFYKDRDGRYLGCNRAFEVHFGTSRNDIVGRTVFNMVPGDMAERFHRSDQELFARPGTQIFEAPVVFADGSRHHAVFHKATFADDQGNVQGLLGVILDLTERRRAEDNLRKLSRAVEQSANAVIITDTEGQIEFVNPKFTLQSGYAPAEVLGLTPRLLKSGALPAEAYDDLWRTISSGKDWRGEFHNRRKDGSLYWVAATLSPVRGPDGEITHYIAIEEDITDRKRAADDLHQALHWAAQAQERLTDAIENLDEAFILSDTGDRVVLWNSRYLEFYPQLKEVIRAEIPFESLVRAFVAAGGPAGVGDDPEAWVAERMERHRRALGTHVQPLGDGRWLLVSENRTSDGGIVSVRTDITAYVRAEEALREAKERAEIANRAKTEFLANMSHELRTPLNSIIGFSDILVHQSFGPMGVPEYQEYAKDINTSGHHLLALINDILDVSRIETDALTLNEQRIDAGQLASSCYRLISERAHKGGLKLELDVEKPLGAALYADERRVKQILLNLLSNAVKFTDPGGSIALRVCIDDQERFVFVVSDTGIGIAPEDIEAALSVFGQVDGSLARRYEGAGLGLPLSKRLAELHDGQLTLSSTPGKGTTVTVRFPATRTQRLAGS